MMRTEHELAQVVSLFKSDYTAAHSPTYRTLKVLHHIESCRTSALGGHVDVCDECGIVHISYNSCRDRHCPKCQGMDREAWVEARKEDILPVKYFHVVFTLPEALHQIALLHRKEVYDALVRASWGTISAFSGNLDIAPAMIAILHTWGSALTYHPHLHCIVPGDTAGGPEGAFRQELGCVLQAACLRDRQGCRVPWPLCEPDSHLQPAHQIRRCRRRVVRVQELPE